MTAKKKKNNNSENVKNKIHLLVLTLKILLIVFGAFILNLSGTGME